MGGEILVALGARLQYLRPFALSLQAGILQMFGIEAPRLDIKHLQCPSPNTEETNMFWSLLVVGMC